jgi:5-methylcytosine-specific restriction endonuclease McrA
MPRFEKGHPGYNKVPNSGSFKKGQKPWNKGKSFNPGIPRSPKGQRNSINSEFKRGQQPWNKGMKGYRAGLPRCPKGYKPWNKGLKGFLAGKNHYNWKGGISSINHKIRTSNDWKEWRTSVFERDNYTCQECGLQGVELHPHHKIPIAVDKTKIFDKDNGITLCIDCHIHSKKYHKNIRRGGG